MNIREDVLNHFTREFTGKKASDYSVEELQDLFYQLSELNKVLNQTEDAIVIIDTNYKVVYHNKTLLLLLGLSDSINGSLWQDVFQQQIPNEIKRIAQEASFNYPSYHDLDLKIGEDLKKFLCSFHPVKNAVMIRISRP